MVRVRLPGFFPFPALLLIAVAASVSMVAPSRAGSLLRGTPVPQRFVGIDVDWSTLGRLDSVRLSRQFDLMVATGVETVRVAFSWANAQPYQRFTDPAFTALPVEQRNGYEDINGVPTSFATTDRIVALAAQRGLTVVPTVLYSPSWAAGANLDGGYSPPAKTAPYAAYLTALIRRYGPHGTFWSNHSPRLAIRMWQIWNEPNLSYYWPQPFAKSYVSLLRAAHTAIKRADPGAQVVLGALTNAAWTYLGQIEKVHGARGAFDVIAVNGFTSSPSNVIQYLQYTRREANRDGARNKPILATELSWPSAKGKTPQHYTWNTTEQGQASRIAALLPMLAAHRRPLQLIGFYYETWMGQERPHAPAFSYAGLLRFGQNGQVAAKPALRAFQHGALAIERCRKKGRLATTCIS